MLPLACLGFLRGSNCTHYSSRPDRPPEFRRYLESNEIPGPGIATDDHVALHYIDTRLHEIVSAAPDARAYIIDRDGGVYKERVIQPRFLGAADE
jgi:peptidase E